MASIFVGICRTTLGERAREREKGALLCCRDSLSSHTNVCCRLRESPSSCRRCRGGVTISRGVILLLHRERVGSVAFYKHRGHKKVVVEGTFFTNVKCREV